MKKTASTRDLILVAVLIVALAYYFGIQRPITNQTDELNAEKATIESDITIAQTQVQLKKKMENELSAILEAADGEPDALPVYDNINNVILEMNSIFGKSKDYSISFNGETEENSVVRRDIRVSFTVDSYRTAIEKLTSIDQSTNRYLIRDVSITDQSDEQGSAFSVTISLTSFDYKEQ